MTKSQALPWKNRAPVAWVAAVGLFLCAEAASAETVELVTYYPTQANTGDLHTGSFTVGDAYRNVTPGDGEVLVFDALGIGLPVGNPVPAGPLHVVGVNGAVSSAVFMPGAGADSDIRVGIGTQNPRTRLDLRGALTLEDVNGAGVIYFRNTQVNPLVPPGLYIRSDDDPATYEAASERVFIGANGRVGIGTQNPATALDLNGALSSRGIAAQAVSPAGQGRIYFDSTTNTFRVSQNGGAYTDLVGGGGGWTDDGTVVRLSTGTDRVGIGTANPAAGTRLDVNGSVRIGGTAGTPIVRVISTTAVLNFPDTDGEDSSRLTATVNGAAIGDVVSLGIPAAAALSNGIYTAWVSAANTVTVQFSNNNSAANQNPPSATFRIMVVKF